MSLRAMVSAGLGWFVQPFFAVCHSRGGPSEPLLLIIGQVAFGRFVPTPTVFEHWLLIINQWVSSTLTFPAVPLPPRSGRQESGTNSAPQFWAHLSVDGVSPAGEAYRPTFPIDLPCELREEQPGWLDRSFRS